MVLNIDLSFHATTGSEGMDGPTSQDNSFSLPSTDPALTDQFHARIVGKLLHIRKFNFKAIKYVLASAWKLGERVTFSPLQPGFIVCNFLCSEDLEKVLKLGSWNFRGSLIVFSHWDPECVFQELEFDSIDTWVQALNLPLCNFNADSATFIGNSIGSFFTVDLGSKNSKSLTHTLRIKVRIYVSRYWVLFRASRKITGVDTVQV